MKAEIFTEGRWTQFALIHLVPKYRSDHGSTYGLFHAKGKHIKDDYDFLLKAAEEGSPEALAVLNDWNQFVAEKTAAAVLTRLKA